MTFTFVSQFQVEQMIGLVHCLLGVTTANLLITNSSECNQTPEFRLLISFVCILAAQVRANTGETQVQCNYAQVAMVLLLPPARPHAWLFLS